MFLKTWFQSYLYKKLAVSGSYGGFFLYAATDPTRIAKSPEFSGRFADQARPDHWVQIFLSNQDPDYFSRSYVVSCGRELIGFRTDLNRLYGQPAVLTDPRDNRKYLKVLQFPVAVGGWLMPLQAAPEDRGSTPPEETILARSDVELNEESMNEALNLLANLVAFRSLRLPSRDICGIAVPRMEIANFW